MSYIKMDKKGEYYIETDKGDYYLTEGYIIDTSEGDNRAEYQLNHHKRDQVGIDRHEK